MATSGDDIKNIIPMSRELIDDVLAVYEKLRSVKSVSSKFSRRKPDESELTAEQMIGTGLGNDYDLSYVYQLNGTVVGFVWGRLAYVGMPVQLVGFIHMVIVDPDLQRKGIARELLDTVARRCAERGVHTLRTVVGERDWELSTFFNEAEFENSGLILYTRTIK